jgi:hypothetical protein
MDSLLSEMNTLGNDSPLVNEAVAIVEKIAPRRFPRTFTMPRTRAPLAAWDREQVRAQIEEATGEPLSVDDSQPDSYVATAQELGMRPHDLTLWIYEHPKVWNTQSLIQWAKHYGFASKTAPGVSA